MDSETVISERREECIAPGIDVRHGIGPGRRDSTGQSDCCRRNRALSRMLHDEAGLRRCNTRISLSPLETEIVSKSTAIKMLTGLPSPKDGPASVLGFAPQSERKRLSFARGPVFGQKRQRWYHLLTLDRLRLLAGLRCYAFGNAPAGRV